MPHCNLDGMKIDITYRTIERSRGRLLRVRFRKEDGESALLLFRDPQEFANALEKANVAESIKRQLEADLLVVSQMQEQVHSCIDLGISRDELARLGASEWLEPQKFNLSFNKTATGDLILAAREVNPLPGFMSLSVKAAIRKDQFAEVIDQVGLKPNEVRDANLYGSQSKRLIDEDEVDLLFDSIKH